MKTFSLVFFLTLIQVVPVTAQFMKDGLGRPIKETKYVFVDGSPFLFDNWLKGEIISDNNMVSKNIELKYDLVEDRVFFRSDKGEEMDFINLITSFSIYSDTGNKYFRRMVGIKEYAGSPFFEVLNEGSKLILLKKMTRAVMESKPYGSASTRRSFSETTRYFLMKADKSYVRVKKEKDSVLNALADKAKEVDVFVKENKINFKKEEDLSKLLTYYNTL